MRAVIQRVRRASVTIDESLRAEIGPGLLVLLAIHQADEEAEARWLAEKIIHLRIFGDESGKMNHDLAEVNGAMLVVSQFTLYGDCRKGRRPSFMDSASPERAVPLYRSFILAVQELGVPVQTGEFGADMQIDLVNDGPVTLIVDSK